MTTDPQPAPAPNESPIIAWELTYWDGTTQRVEASVAQGGSSLPDLTGIDWNEVAAAVAAAGHSAEAATAGLGTLRDAFAREYTDERREQAALRDRPLA